MDYSDTPPNYPPPPPPKDFFTGTLESNSHSIYHLSPSLTHHTKGPDPRMNREWYDLSAGEKTALWFSNTFSSLSRRWYTHLFLITFMILYTVLGAYVFVVLEGPYEEKYSVSLVDTRREVATRINDFILKNQTFSYFVDENNDFVKVIEEYLVEYEVNYSEHMKNMNVMPSTEDIGVHKTTWNLWNSLFYASTIYTTIGYGHIVPKTTYGRIATILYGVVGIPIFLIFLIDFGKLFARILKFFWAFIRRFCYTKSCKKAERIAPIQNTNWEQSSQQPSYSDVPPPLPPKPSTLKRSPRFISRTDDEFNLPITIAVFLLVIYIIVGVFSYNLLGTWNYFEAFYFVFISLSTIGLGDLVIGRPRLIMASIVYLIFGLVLICMCIIVVQTKLSNICKKARAKIQSNKYCVKQKM